jgi:hypothetical protein
MVALFSISLVTSDGSGQHPTFASAIGAVSFANQIRHAAIMPWAT